MPAHYSQTRIALRPLRGLRLPVRCKLTPRTFAPRMRSLPIDHADGDHRRCSDPMSSSRRLACRVRCVVRALRRSAVQRDVVALRALRRAYGEHTCFHRVSTSSSAIWTTREAGVVLTRQPRQQPAENVAGIPRVTMYFSLKIARYARRHYQVGQRRSKAHGPEHALPVSSFAAHA